MAIYINFNKFLTNIFNYAAILFIDILFLINPPPEISKKGNYYLKKLRITFTIIIITTINPITEEELFLSLDTP